MRVHRFIPTVIMVLAGFLVGWFSHRHVARAEYTQSVLVHQLVIIGLSGLSLETLDAGRSHATIKILEHNLSSSLREAHRLLQTGGRPPEFPIPNLIEGVRRGGRYAARYGLEGTDLAEPLLQRLEAPWASRRAANQ